MKIDNAMWKMKIDNAMWKINEGQQTTDGGQQTIEYGQKTVKIRTCQWTIVNVNSQ